MNPLDELKELTRKERVRMEETDKRILYRLPIVVLGLLIVVVVSHNFGSRMRCVELSEMTGRKTTWRTLSGCFVGTREGMVPVDKWKVEE